MNSRMLPWELVGAVIGAGLASGREIASFFSKYGCWSWAAIAVSVIVMGLLADARIPSEWQDGWPERMWKLLLSLLLTATGGTMLAGAGEVAALMLPVHGAYWLGMAGTLGISWLLAKQTVNGLAWVSRALLAVMTVLIAAGLMIPPMQAAYIANVSVSEALLRGVTYGGFNAALQRPVVDAHDRLSERECRRGKITACLVLALLIMLGNAVLLRHPALLGEPMPFVRLMKELGMGGYVLGAVSLYLAILSTLTACLRGLGGPFAAAGIILAASVGFTGAVERIYPLLGGGCLLMLLWAKLRNYR
ncbi:MAG: hypothetical protein IJZ74_01255 [Clostridia bacterium]|nr:hypothetical protein [Clostridia bacterium]